MQRSARAQPAPWTLNNEWNGTQCDWMAANGKYRRWRNYVTCKIVARTKDVSTASTLHTLSPTSRDYNNLHSFYLPLMCFFFLLSGCDFYVYIGILIAAMAIAAKTLCDDGRAHTHRERWLMLMSSIFRSFALFLRNQINPAPSVIPFHTHRRWMFLI